MNIFRAGVVGAGAMGSEIAQVISSCGLPVLLVDVDQRMLDRGMETVRRIYQSRVDKGKMSAGDVETAMALITPTLSYEGFADADIIIEAAPEKIGIKTAVLRELDAIAPETAILASNTSALSISELAAATRRPGKIVGMHFFNPAHIMRLVEVIPGLETEPETVADVVSFAEQLRKTPVVVQECPGFVVNRLLFPYLNEAAYCLQEGAGAPAEIDAAVKAFGMPMGPFTLMDVIGIDVCCHIQDYLHSEYGPRMATAPILHRLRDAGRLGRKAGAGFYGYGGGADEAPAQAPAAELGRAPEGEFSVQRVIHPLLNEAIIAAQERIASVPDIDLAMMNGAGMGYGGERKGPLAIADQIGLDRLLAELEGFHARYGERFRPARLLRNKVRAGHLGVVARRGVY